MAYARVGLPCSSAKSAVFLLWSCCVLGAGMAHAADAEAKDNEVISVPVVVNVLDKAGTVTQARIDGLIAEANKILKKAKVQLVKKHVNPKFTDGGNDDGRIAESEESNLDKKGAEECKKHCGSGKGYKICFAKQIRGKDGTYGLAPMCNPNLPVIYLKVTTESVVSQGNDLAHEACHVASLGKHHLVSTTPTVRADAKGHTTDTNNLLYPRNGGGFVRGSGLTPEQIKEIRKGFRKRGKVKATLTTPTRAVVPQTAKRGSSVDALSEPPSGLMLDINSAMGFHNIADTDVEFRLGIGELFTTTPIQVVYTLYLDIDDDTVTGQAFPPFEGIDRLVEIVLDGEYPFEGSGFREAMLIDTAGGGPMPLDPPGLIRQLKVDDVFPPDEPSAEAFMDTIMVTVPAPLIDQPSPFEMFVGVRAFSPITFDEDITSFTMTELTDLDPILDVQPLDARPGDEIRLLGGGFPPLTPIDVFIDGEGVGAFQTQPDGTWDTGLTVPELPAGDYFLTVQDPVTGDFDFSWITIEALPGTTAVSPGLWLRTD